MSRILGFGLTALCASCLSSCSGEGMDGSVPIAETTEGVSGVNSYSPPPPNPTDTVDWGYQYEFRKQGRAGRVLQPVGNNACFLTAITPEFHPTSDMLEVVQVDGQWVERGSDAFPNDYNLTSDAFCVTSSVSLGLTDEFSAGTKAVVVNWDLDESYTCGLVRVQGMNTTAAAVYARLENVGAALRWVLHTEGNASGAVRCVQRPKSAEAHNIQPSYGLGGGGVVSKTNNDYTGTFCMLNGAHGKFQIPGDYIGVRLDMGTNRQWSAWVRNHAGMLMGFDAVCF